MFLKERENDLGSDGFVFVVAVLEMMAMQEACFVQEKRCWDVCLNGVESSGTSAAGNEDESVRRDKVSCSFRISVGPGGM